MFLREYLTELEYEILCNKYGYENIISCFVHLDENCEHSHFCFAPISEGKFNAKKILNIYHICVFVNINKFFISIILFNIQN